MAPPRPRGRSYRCKPLPSRVPSDRLVTLFEARATARLARGTAIKYRWALRSVLWVAQQLDGRPVTLIELFRDEALLGRTLASDLGRGGRQRSRWTIAHHRTAIRAAATQIRPELIELLRENPHDVIRRALRGAATPIGTGFRLGGGVPRARGGIVPTAAEVREIIRALGEGGDWRAARDQALGLFLAGTASRITAARTLNAADCHAMKDGSIRVIVQQKSHRDPREVELGDDEAMALRRYIHEANRARIGPPIALGSKGPLWRGEQGGVLPDAAFRTSLRLACHRAGTPNYTPHAFRRFWATQASLRLPRWDAALGGGWSGTGQFDAHYAQPSRADVWTRLGRLGKPNEAAPVERGTTRHEPTVLVS